MTSTISVEYELSDVEIDESVSFIASLQLASGYLPRSTTENGDPWNLTEALMALCAGGAVDRARAGFVWLARNQAADGSWCAAYDLVGNPSERYADTNATAYVACGVLHYVMATGDLKFAAQMFPFVERALGFVLAHQRRDGAIAWSVRDGVSASKALLAGSSSVLHSLLAGSALAELLHLRRPEWRASAERIRVAICNEDDAFINNDAYAMDWYYPVLVGAVCGERGNQRLDAGWGDFVHPQYGVLCRSDRRWVTTAETAECAIALWRQCRIEDARTMLGFAQHNRLADGSYRTGVVYPEGNEFPRGERTSYSAAAVVLAADLLRIGVGTTAVFSLGLSEGR